MPALTPLRATFVMVGAGVGAGIMAVPYLAQRVGLPAMLLILVVAWAAATFIHLMLIEILLRTGEPLQVIELMRLWVLDGGRRRWLLWLAFALLTLAFVAALAAYIAAQSEIVSAATGLPEALCHLLVYAASAGVVLFGLRAVGVFESLGSMALIGCVVVLLAGSLGARFELPITVQGTPGDALALFAMIMYGTYAFFSVPQVVKGLAPDGRRAARSVVAGLVINGLLIAVVAIIALAVSDEVSEVAIIGIADALGPWAGGIGSSLRRGRLADDLLGRVAGPGGHHRRAAATGPAGELAARDTALAAAPLRRRDALPRAAAAGRGITALVIALVTVPMYVNARRRGPVTAPDWALGRWGGRPMLGLALLATVLMAVGSLLQT